MRSFLAAVVLLSAASAFGDMRLEGPFGVRLDRMIANHLEATDAVRLAQVFHERDERQGWWRTEFWGKYMHSAVPFRDYAGSERLARAVDAGLDSVLAAQEDSGYIGDYAEGERCGHGWDVWGIKYTLMGLIHYVDGERRKEKGESEDGGRAIRALEAAKRLCDCLISEFGREGHPAIRETGGYGGMPSCSVLEPVVWLYNRTHEKRYLDFAAYIVKELTERPDGPNLVKLADVPVADRRFEAVPSCRAWRPDVQLTKAYELMSCYQGLLEYYEVTGRKDLFDAALKTAESIATTEINLAGGSAAGEHWYHGAREQHRHISNLQETCVTITWMRLCAKLLKLTKDPVWADRLERTFYNAYLASLSRDGSTFAAYTPLMGCRSAGHHHCKAHTNCCNANGARGFLAFLESFASAEGDAMTLNFYASGRAAAKLPASGEEAAFRLYTVYPREGDVSIRYVGTKDLDFALRLRIPAFSSNTVVKVNGKPFEGAVAAGSYCEIRRRWSRTDEVSVAFELPVRMHRLGEHVAFTRGPVALARDSRFNDGALDDEINVAKFRPETLGTFALVQVPDPEMFLAVAAILPSGSHPENPDGGIYPQAIHFTDYASAGDLWRPDCRFRVWLPELVPGRNY